MARHGTCNMLAVFLRTDIRWREGPCLCPQRAALLQVEVGAWAAAPTVAWVASTMAASMQLLLLMLVRVMVVAVLLPPDTATAAAAAAALTTGPLLKGAAVGSACWGPRSG